MVERAPAATAVRPLSTGSRLLLLLLTLAVVSLAMLAGDRAWLPLLVPVALLAGGLVLLLWRRNDLRLRHVLFFAVVFRLMLFWLPPSLSDDAYRYVWDGWVQVNGHNPYRYTPSDPALVDLQDEPVYEVLNSPSYFTVYPPLSQVLFAVGGLVAPYGWQASYFLIKAILVLFEVGALLLLSRMVSVRSLILYAWHPLVLLETAGQAHTENLLVFFLVGTLYAASRGHGGRASLCLTGAGLVKLLPFVLLPFLWRRFGWRAVWVSGLTIVGFSLPYAAPYVIPHLRSSLDLYVRLFEFNAGFYYGLKEMYRLFTGLDWSKTLGPALRGVFLLSLVLWYALDIRRKWSLERAFMVVMGAYLVLATTVHPWYFLGLLAVAACMERPAWHWLWVGMLSIGTYLLYVDGPYMLFVVAGWGGWGILALWRHAPGALQELQYARAGRKLAFIASMIPRWKRPLRVLDLGAGEGYVGLRLAESYQADVQLVDVLDMNRTRLPHRVYDGTHLPEEGGAYDLVMLYFVLHHAESPEHVLQEAGRVSHGRVLVVESVYEHSWDLRLLTVLDRAANRLRSGGRMRGQEAHLSFRTISEWLTLFSRQGFDVVATRRRGRWVHRQAAFLLRPKRRAISVIAIWQDSPSETSRSDETT